MFIGKKKIGEGYYYVVYDIGNGRVVKKQKKRLRFLIYILYMNKTSLQGVKEYKRALRNIINIKSIYEKLVGLIPDLSIVGNPIFIGGIDYTQDNTTQLKDVLPTKPVPEAMSLLEEFINVIKELWKYGCHEKSLNFFTNFGLSKDGKVILMDFNEVTFDKAEVAIEIDKMQWLNNWSYTQLPMELQNYYKKRLEEEITLNNLISLWDINNNLSAPKNIKP